MSEVWFNALDGHLLIGADAYEQAVEQTGPGDLIPLQDILTADELPVDPGNYDKRSSERDPDDYLAIGALAFRLIQSVDPSETLKRQHLKRLFDIGLAPDPQWMIGARNAFKTISILRDQIEAPQTARPMGAFDNWTTSEYVAFARRVEASVGGRKPTKAEYEAYARLHPDEPSIGIIGSHVRGGVSLLNDYIGYPNTQGWGQDEYLDYGIKVIEVNGTEQGLNQTVFLALATAKRGPHYQTISRAFDGWENYKRAVIEAREQHAVIASEERTRKLKQYRNFVEKNTWQKEAYEALDDDQIIQRGGRQVVIDELFRAGEGSLSYLQVALETQSSQAFVAALRRANPRLTAGDIEACADMLGVFDDLWPMEDYKEYLKVSADTLAATRALRASQKAQLRRKKTAATV